MAGIAPHPAIKIFHEIPGHAPIGMFFFVSLKQKLSFTFFQGKYIGRNLHSIL